MMTEILTEEEKAELNVIIDAGLTARCLRARMFPLDFADVWNVGASEYLYAKLRKRFGILRLGFEK